MSLAARRWPLLVALGLVVGLLIGLSWPRASGLDLPAETSPEVSFARDMSAHHAQAVAMSVTLLKRASDPAVRLLAQDIALGQQSQIGQMSGWLMVWGRPLSGLEPPMAGMDRAAMGLASSADERSLDKLAPVQAERRFLTLMRRHHLGGVSMASEALKTVERPEVRAFAERVVAAQTSEITVIDAMLAKRPGTDPVPAPMPPMEGMPHE
jgi:uncharacterized protein (DUF305 family)